MLLSVMLRVLCPVRLSNLVCLGRVAALLDDRTFWPGILVVVIPPLQSTQPRLLVIGILAGGVARDQHLSRLVAGVFGCRMQVVSVLGPPSPLELLHLLVLEVAILLMLLRAWPLHDPLAVLRLPNHGRPLG